MAIQDFGKKIGGARKDLWAARGLRIEDIEDFNLAERAKYITKNNIWPKPDYEKMMNEEGYSRDALYFIKTVRDSIPTSPVLSHTDSEEEIMLKQEVYIEFLTDFKEELLKVKTAQDIGDIGIQYLADHDYVYKDYHSYKMTNRGEVFINNKFFKALQMSPGQAQREATKKQFLADNLGAIKERFEIIEIDGSLSNENAWWNKDGTVIKRDRYSSTDYFYPAAAEIGDFLKGMDLENYRGNFLIVRDNYIIGITHDYLEAQQFVEQRAQDIFDKSEQDKAAAKEAKKADPERKKGLTPPILEHIIRTGPEMRVGNVVGDDFIKDFSIKGGEFGNWLNEAERQTNMNMAYDSFKDMAKALKINDADIAMGGKLNIAFGSRGRKGAAAHYEPLREVINLTKMKGAGSLAHEFFHAMDDIAAKEKGLKSGTFATQEHRIQSAFTELIQAMRYKTITLTKEDLEKEDKALIAGRVSNLQTEIEKMVPYSTLTPEKIAQRNRLVIDLVNKAKTGEVLFREFDFSKTRPKAKINPVINDLCTFIDNNSKNYRMTGNNKEWLAGQLDGIGMIARNATMEERAKGREEKKVETEFYKNSQAMDAAFTKAGHGYWASEIEMAARAFACYVYDKLEEMGVHNDYLTGHAFQVADIKGNTVHAYPDKEEREVINKAFDKIIEEMKTMGIFHDRDERQLAAETEHCFVVAERTENYVHFTVMDKDFNEISDAKMMPTVSLQAAIKQAVSLGDNGSEITQMDYSVFEAKKAARQEELHKAAQQKALQESMNVPPIDPNSYQQMTFEDVIAAAKTAKMSAEKSDRKSGRDER